MILSNRKLKLIIISLLLLIFAYFLGIFKANALQYTIDINMKSQVLLGSNLSDKFFINDSSNPELVLDINKTISCDTSVCLASIPLTLSAYSTVAGSYQSGDIISHTWDYLGMYAQLWGSSPNYSCSYSNGTLDCPITNGQELKKIEIFTGQKNTQTGVVNYSRGAFINVYNIQNVGTTINNIQNNTNNINNSINDSNIDSNNASSSASTWNSKNATNGVITQLLTLPISLLQAIVNGIQTTCSSFSLGSLFGTNIILPCINLNTLIGSALFTTIDILFSGFMILSISKKMIKIFNDFTNLKSNQIDELYGGGN